MNESFPYRLLNQYNQVDFLIENLPESFLKTRPAPGKWSILENLAHLGRYQEIFIERIERILNEEKPTFERYIADDDPFFEMWRTKTTKEIILKTKRDRKLLANKIVKLSDQNLNRTGMHPKLGSMNISAWAEFFLLHESHHFYTIFWLVHENKK